MRTSLLLLAAAAAAWGAWLAAFGGVNGDVLGIRIRSNNPSRVFILASAALAGYFLAGGRIPFSAIAARLRRIADGCAKRPAPLAVALALAVVAAAIAGSTRIAGGADAYGYVSQADLWLARNPRIPQPWADRVPWPDGRWTFTPLGYRPSSGADPTIVPTYSPGLPLLMAGAKAVAGHCAVFMVVPLLAGLAVFATYGLGRRLGSAATGLVAAWFVATSPVVLLEAMEPLTDVPVMAAWAAAFYLLLGRTRMAWLAAGLAGGLAILIRPNLVALAAAMAAWLLFRRGLPWRERIVAVALFGIGVTCGAAAVAAINSALYGSPTTSGYGSLADQFAWTRVLPNLRRYFTWFVETQTPFALLGFAALAVPTRWSWPDVRDRSVFVLIGVYLALLWLTYAGYLEFDSWGYLRFLLPGWPLIMLGLAAVVTAAARAPSKPVRAVMVVAAIALGVWNVQYARRAGVFDQRQAARHEAPIGSLVRAHTPANSVILAFERSGSLRYYAGRVTLRYDLLDPAWLDRAVAWLQGRGVAVYAVLDARQATEFKQRFTGQLATAALDRPVLVYEPAATALYDFAAAPLQPALPGFRLQAEGNPAAPVVIAQPPAGTGSCDPPLPLAPLIVREGLP